MGGGSSGRRDTEELSADSLKLVGAKPALQVGPRFLIKGGKERKNV